ncbi:sensor histidine kinase [Dyadobacter sp.]|uniref:sensor histidine kinase n=1 Tax=Dyadobacter sp. TaxID=1914288 RepID=UPI003F708650
MTTKDKVIRFSLHFLTWLITWVVLRYSSIPSLTKDNLAVVWHASTVVFIQSVIVFYLLGYVVFPRFLYQKRVLGLIVCLAVLFQLIYSSNVYEFKYLASISDGSLDGKPLYVSRLWNDFLKVNEWNAWLTDFKLAYINYAWSLFFVTPILAIKVMRDTITIRTQNLRLERDRLQLEKNNLDLQSQSLELQRDNLNLELSFLKSQINPHFLFNTLNAVYAKTADLDESAAELVLRLSNLMRYSLYESNRDKVILSKEIDYIESYIDLEKARFGEKVTITYQLEGDPDRYVISPLLLISFVENAFKHGVSKSLEHAFVNIKIVLEDSTLFFSIENSTPATLIVDGKKTLDEIGGFGLQNTTKRLKLLYPERHNFSVEKRSGTFHIDLQIDLTSAPVPQITATI